MSAPVLRWLVGAVAVVVLALAATLAPISSAAGNFAPGNLVIYRVGSGTGALVNTGSPVFLDEYTPAGSLVQSVALPTTASGANQPLIASGTASSEGLLSRSQDGRYLLATGYGTTLGTAGLAGTSGATVPRVVARVDSCATIDTSTALSDFASGNNPRSATSANGSAFWVAGGAGSVRYVASLGATTSTDLTGSTFANVRQLNVFGDQLYASTGSGTNTFKGVDTVGAGLPTTSPQTVTRLPGLTDTSDPSTYGFFLADLDSSVPGFDTLYVADDSTGTLSKFSLVGSTWTANGTVGFSSDSYRGLVGSVNGSSVTLFATRNGGTGATGGGQLVTLTDASGYNGAFSGTPAVLATAATNTAFRGVAFAPTDSCGGSTPTPTPTPTSTPIGNSNPPTLSAVPALSGALGDTTNPGVDVTVSDDVTAADSLTLTATNTSNAAVAPLANVTISAGTAGQRTVHVQPIGVGYADITLTVTDGDSLTATGILHYAASAASTTPATTRYLMGSSDASTAQVVDANLMFVADDENQGLRLYQRSASGMPVASFDFTSSLGLTDTSGGVPREVDIEASARAGDRIYWLGSGSNSSDGASRPNRQRLFATTLSGTTLSFVGYYDHLKNDLIAWDASNAHGKGANHYGLAASAAVGVIPEAPDGSGFNIEGLEFAPGSTTTAYVAFRAPISPATNRTRALIVPVTNMDALVGGAPSAGPATFGAPIELDLNGRGIREIRKNAADQYLISAGPAAGGSDFRLYTWSGNAADAPVPHAADLSGITAIGAIESIVEVPNPLADTSVIQLVSDNGDTIYYGDGISAKDLAEPRFKKSRGDLVTLGPAVTSPRIHDIQGAAHISPLVGQSVADVPGIVTALRSNGFYLQDPQPDANPATSEGVFVFTSSAPKVAVGDDLRVSGRVSEFRSGGATGTSNLTGTEIDSPGIVTLSKNNALPDPIVIGSGGRVPPNRIIEDDATSGNVETSGIFDPDSDAIDFYESLEGMRVQVNNAVVVGPTQVFGSGSSLNSEIDVVADNGSDPALLRSFRGGVMARKDNFNPGRVIFNDLLSGGPRLPAASVSDTFPGATVGVLDYSFGNFKLEVATLPALVSGGLTRTVAATPGANDLVVGGFNVENLSPNDPPTKFATLASLIVTNLGSPDLISVEEIQDNNGATDNGNVDATQTYNLLTAAIVAAGGPHYEVRQIDPVNDQDGGQPGGNIRQGFLFRSDRGLSFVDRPGGTSTTGTTIDTTSPEPHLTFSPGRLDPTNVAWTASRKPLVGEFTYNGQTLFVIANHIIAKAGDDPLFGKDQPPIEVTKPERLQQAQELHDFVGTILGADPNANVVVLGDLNDYEFSDPMLLLTGANTPNPVLTDLVNTLPENQRYSYDFQGNTETLDHIMTTQHLTPSTVLQPIHVNAEFANQASDHDPMLARITVVPDTTPPDVAPNIKGSLGGGGWYTSDVTVTWSVADAQSSVTSTSGCDLVTLTADTGGTTLTCTATSAGGTTIKTTTVKIDRTAPELFSQFDPLSHDIDVLGRDAGSGVPSGPLAPVVTRGGTWTDDDDEDDDHSWSIADTRAQIRVYTVTDAAGNSSRLLIKIRVAPNAIKSRDQSLQYNMSPSIDLPRNVSRFSWTLSGTAFKTLSQHMVVAGSGQKDRQVTDADWTAKSNTTHIVVSRPKPGLDTTRPGQVLLRLATSSGELVIEF